LFRAAAAAAMIWFGMGAAAAQSLPVRDAALAEDAATIAPRLGLTPAAAARLLELQVASVPVTDAIAARFADRLTGIAIEHTPVFRIVVRLKGDAPVTGEVATIAGQPVTIVYVPGAFSSRAEMLAAISAFQALMRASLDVPPGLGIDQRSGELVAIVSARDVAREGAQGLRDRLASMTQVPVRLRVINDPSLDLAGNGLGGGVRLTGVRPGDSQRYLCTSAFAVTDGARDALTTAAHCPDDLSIRDSGGRRIDLPFAGQWGWGNRDVQLNLSAVPLGPDFYTDAARTRARAVTGAQSRAATRAGDVVCHRGERTGYSCARVELTDFAPAGDLCGGACLPTWITVAGPSCKGGDSGSPVFLGTVAHGILKGGSYRADGGCAFYFYMSTDYLPEGWRLRIAGDPPPIPAPGASPGAIAANP
jgi:CBS domain-containing protein